MTKSDIAFALYNTNKSQYNIETIKRGQAYKLSVSLRMINRFSFDRLQKMFNVKRLAEGANCDQCFELTKI